MSQHDCFCHRFARQLGAFFLRNTANKAVVKFHLSSKFYGRVSTLSVVHRIVKKCRLRLRWVAIPVWCSVISAQAFADPQSLDSLTGQWLELEKQKGKMQQQWGERKSYLQQRIELLDVERNSLQEVKQSANESIAKIDKERSELLEGQLRLERESELLANSIAYSLTHLNQLSSKFPPPLSDQWQKKIANIELKKSLSEKLEFILSVFKSIGEFNQRIVLHRGTINLTDADGAVKTIMANQVYMGVGHGWYVSDDQIYYGYGNADSGTWRWWHGVDAAAKLKVDFTADMVVDVVKILQEPTQARYVPLPISFTKLGEDKP